MNPTDNDRVNLDEAWQRLSDVCGKLWNENSPSAVALQAVIEEFKTEISRADQIVAASRRAVISERQTLEKRLGAAHADRVAALESQIKDLSARGASLEQSLVEKDRHAQTLIRELGEKERQNKEFYDQYLKTAVNKDEIQAKKMNDFYNELREKEDSLEAGWNARHKTLEAEYQTRLQALETRQEESAAEAKRRAEDIEKRHAKLEKEIEDAHDKLLGEIGAWESRRLQEDQKLHADREQLVLREQELAAEYRKKQQELQSIKEGLQKEIADMVHQYQAKIKEKAERSAGESGGVRSIA